MSLTSCREFADLTYTPFYCEENIWKLCDRVQTLEGDQICNCHVVFISDFNEMVPIWGQKAGDKERDHLVIWDYHVIMVHSTREGGSNVYDFDTILPFPIGFQEYCSNNLRECQLKQSDFHYLFRVIPAVQYLQTFASDRSRMRTKEGLYIKPPPEYSCICTAEETNNLNRFISMDQSFSIGEVINLQQLKQVFNK